MWKEKRCCLQCFPLCCLWFTPSLTFWERVRISTGPLSNFFFGRTVFWVSTIFGFGFWLVGVLDTFQKSYYLELSKATAEDCCKTFLDYWSFSQVFPLEFVWERTLVVSTLKVLQNCLSFYVQIVLFCFRWAEFLFDWCHVPRTCSLWGIGCNIALFCGLIRLSAGLECWWNYSQASSYSVCWILSCWWGCCSCLCC